jgi:hypothetical protein
MVLDAKVNVKFGFLKVLNSMGVENAIMTSAPVASPILSVTI